jgi:hypothetical protein
MPWLVLRYPASTGIEPSVWSGPLEAETVKALVNSPARRELARRLVHGDTAVWLLLESGDKERDDSAARIADAESRKLEQTLELPEPAPGDPPIAAGLPLRIAFSTFRVARSDPAERLFVAQLLNWNPQMGKVTEPVLFPVFGRGRALPPVFGEGIRAEVLAGIGRLLTGPCSCQLKELNPGFDLLMATKWDAVFAGQELKSATPPTLTSLSQFAAGVRSNSAATPQPPNVSRPHNRNLSEPIGRSRLVGTLVWVLGSGVVAVGIATLLLKVAGKSSP